MYRGLGTGLCFEVFHCQGTKRLAARRTMVSMSAHLLRTGGTWNNDRLERGIIRRNRGRVRAALTVRAPHYAAQTQHSLGTAFGAVHDDLAVVTVEVIAGLIAFLHQFFATQRNFPTALPGTCPAKPVLVLGLVVQQMPNPKTNKEGEGGQGKDIPQMVRGLDAPLGLEILQRQGPQRLAARRATEGFRADLVTTHVALDQIGAPSRRCKRKIRNRRRVCDGAWGIKRSRTVDGIGCLKLTQAGAARGLATRHFQIGRIANGTSHGGLILSPHLRMNVGICDRNEERFKNDIANHEADDHPENDPQHFHGGHLRPGLQRLAARRATEGFRADLVATHVTWDQIRAPSRRCEGEVRNRRRVCGGALGINGSRCLGRFGKTIGGTGFGGRRFVKDLDIVPAFRTPHPCASFLHLGGIALQTFHGSLNRVSQLCRPWPREFFMEKFRTKNTERTRPFRVHASMPGHI